MGDHYVLGFAPALRFPQTQILCRLYKSSLDETINRGPSVYMYAERSPMRVKDPVVHVRVWWIMEKPKPPSMN